MHEKLIEKTTHDAAEPPPKQLPLNLRIPLTVPATLKAAASGFRLLPRVDIFITIALAPDASSFALPAVTRGLFPDDTEGKHLTGLIIGELGLRLSIDYIAAQPLGLGGSTNIDEVGSALGKLFDEIVAKKNVELMAREKGRGCKLRWEILRNAEYRRRYGYISGGGSTGGGVGEGEYLGGWKQDPKTRSWTQGEGMHKFPLNRAIYVHIALSTDGKRGKVFAVPVGIDLQTVDLFGSDTTWDEVAQSAWDQTESGFEGTTAKRVLEALGEVWSKKRTDAGLEQVTSLGFDAELLCRLFPKWTTSMPSQILALENPSSDLNLPSGITVSEAGKVAMMISKTLSYRPPAPSILDPM